MKVNIGLTEDPEKATDSGIGAGVDSFFEYLVKGYVLLNDETLLEIWRQLEIPIEKFLNQNIPPSSSTFIHIVPKHAKVL